MTTKQVLNLSAIFLGKEELLNSPYFTGEDAEPDEDDERELKVLLKCLNLIVNEISTDYLPIYKQKELKISEKHIKLTEIDENIYQIVKITDKYGVNLKFKIINGELLVDSDFIKIVYTSFAQQCFLDGDVENFNNLMPDRVLAYGVSMEYSFMNSLYDDAKIWESRYKNALLILSAKKHNLNMPARRWI